MKLSEQEWRIVTRLKTKQDSWRQHRWYILIGGLLSIVVGCWLVFEVHARALAANSVNAELLVTSPMFWTLVIQGLIMTVLTLTNWHGSDVNRLLLRLLDEPEP